ncbi:MAG: dihydroorotase [Alphaproteobacteria bacterium]|nr:dihydroorotase [Alphaproteobacteria bacterium]
MADFFATAQTKAAPSGRVAYVNARLFDPESGRDEGGALLTDGRQIVDLGPRLFNEGVPEGTEVVDCGGFLLAPGLVDMHVHFREPGHEHKETLATGSRAAAAGGVTTVACMPNTEPPIDDVALVHFIERRARDTAIVKVHPIAAITRGLRGEEIAEMGMLKEAGALAFSDDGLPVYNSRVMRRALSYSTTFDALIVQHAEDPQLSSCGCMNESETATRLGLPGIPNASEVVIVERDIRLVEITGARYHVAHISTAEAVDAVRRAKARGLRVSAEAAPHHFTLNETAVGDYRTFAKMAPPLRSEADRQAVLEGLKDGTIDAIATDHAPHDQDSKRLPFAHAANGIVGLETLLPLALELVHARHMSLREVLATVTIRPARLLGLECGRLAKGAPADLTVIDPDRSWQVDRDRFQSKSKNSPFDGRAVRGLALRTVVGGCTVFRRDG